MKTAAAPTTTLNDVDANPTVLTGASRRELVQLLAKSAAVRAVIEAELASLVTTTEEAPESLSSSDAAAQLGISTSALHRRSTELPYSAFRLPLRGRWNKARILEWLRDPDAFAAKYGGLRRR